MPRKNKEEYNQYMKGYMRKKNSNDKEIPVMDNDFNASTKPKLDLQGDATKQLMNLGKEVFVDPETGKPDKIMKYLEKGIKYMPLIMKFVEGFTTNMGAANAKQVKEDPAVPKPPEGWLNLLPMDKLKYKYSRPSWYAAGEAYEDYVATGIMNPAVNIHKVDAGYQDPPTSRHPTQPPEQPIPNSLAELSKQNPDPPLMNDQAMPVEEMEVKKKTSKKEEKKLEQKENTAEYEQLAKVLQADNAKYVELFVEWINDKSMQDFKSIINNVDQQVEKLKAFSILLPVSVKEMLKQTPATDMEMIVKTRCSEKYKWLKSAKKVGKLLKLFDELKKSLN